MWYLSSYFLYLHGLLLTLFSSRTVQFSMLFHVSNLIQNFKMIESSPQLNLVYSCRTIVSQTILYPAKNKLLSMFVILSRSSPLYFNMRLVQWNSSNDTFQPVIILWVYYTVSHSNSIMIMFVARKLGPLYGSFFSHFELGQK